MIKLFWTVSAALAAALPSAAQVAGEPAARIIARQAQAAQPSAWTADQLQALQVAQDYIDQNRPQLGLGPIDAPIPKMVSVRPDPVIAGDAIARITYEPQSYKGLVVEGTRIDIVIASSNNPAVGTHINAGGHWCQGLALCEIPALTADQARQKLLGAQLGSWGVPPFAVTQSMLGASAALVVVSPGDPSRIQPASNFHLTWKIQVNRGPMAWDVYVDAQDGAIVKRAPLFQE